MKVNISMCLAAVTVFAGSVQFSTISTDVVDRFRRRGAGGRRRNDAIMRQIVQRVNRRQRLMAQFERMKRIVAAYER